MLFSNFLAIKMTLIIQNCIMMDTIAVSFLFYLNFVYFLKLPSISTNFNCAKCSVPSDNTSTYYSMTLPPNSNLFIPLFNLTKHHSIIQVYKYFVLILNESVFNWTCSVYLVIWEENEGKSLGWMETNQSNICKHPYLTSVSMPSPYYHQPAKQTSRGQMEMLDGLVSTHWKVCPWTEGATMMFTCV